MGEPALQLPEEDQPDIKPRLQALEGGGESTPKKSDHLKAVDGNKESIAAAENGEGEASENAYGSSALDDINDTLGRGFHNDGKKSLLSRGFNSKSKLKKRLAIAGAVGAGGVIASILAFFALLPLKIESLVTNLESRAGAASTVAMQKETTHLFKGYINNVIIDGLNKPGCHSTVDANCVFVANGTGPVGKVYQAWKQDRLEQKLATRYGLSIGKSGNTYYINTGGEKVSFKDKAAFQNFLDHDHTTGGKLGDIETQLAKRLKEGTLWDRVYYRFRLAPYLNKKYGIRHCINSCKTVNEFKDDYKTRKKAAKAYILRRVISPLSLSYGLILQCVLEGNGSCANLKLDKAEAGDTTRQTPTNKELQDQLDKYAARFGADSLEELAKLADSIGTDGFQKAMAKELAKKIGSLVGKETSGEAASKAVPVVGWVLLIAKVSNTAEQIGPILRYTSYAANAAAAAQLFTAYQSVSSEMKSGQIDATQLGSFNDALSTNLSGSQKDQSDATQTPYYQSILGSTQTRSQTAFLNEGIVGTASAAANSKEYLCSDGNPVPNGQLICDEEKLSRGNDVANSISSGMKSITSKIPGYHALIKVINFVGDLVGSAFGAAFTKSCNTAGKPFGCPAAVEKVGQLASDFMTFLINKLVSSPITPNMSGGRIFDMMAAGAQVSFNSSCQEDLGCPSVSDATAAKIQASYLQEQQNSFNQRPFFARMFSTDTPYSLVSKLAVSMPSSLTTAGTGLASSLQQNPLNSIGSIVSTIFNPPSASAAISASSVNPFGVPQSGYTDSQIPKNPEQFWKNHCVNGPEGKWTESNPVGQQLDISEWLNTPGNVTQDPDTGQAIFLKPNRCLLILASVQSAGGLADPTLLPQDSQTSDGTNSSGGTLRIATFNVQGAGHTGGSFESRADKSISAIQSNGIEVSGMQEFTPKQRNYFMSKLTNFDNFPKGGDNTGHRIENSILWDKTKYTLVDSGYQPGLVYFCGSKLSAPWVRLRSISTSQEFYVLNTHDPAFAPAANSCSADAARQRYENAKAHVAFLTQLQSKNLPIFFTGDFNSPYTQRASGNGTAYQGKDENLTYCILTSSGLVNDSYDVFRNRPIKCPNPITNKADRQKIEDIDHVYISKGMGVTNWTAVDKATAGSDHVLEIFDVAMPGAGAASGGTTVASPGTGFVGNDGFGGGSCVDYVKYILSRHSSKYRSGPLGDGKDVASNLGGYGYTVNHIPAIHAVVSFPTSMANPVYGHVAIVGKINADGSIVVEESNWSTPNRYGTHTVAASKVKLLTFAHTEVGWH